MSRWLPLAALAVLAQAMPERATAQGAQQPTLVRAGTVFTGDGRVLHDVRILIQDGKFAAIEQDRGPLPEGARVLDFRRRTLMPGLVAAHTELTATDQQRNITPGLVASAQFDFYRKWTQLVRTGLTTVYLSPGRLRLIPGQGSVVKLAGKDPATRLLAEEAALRIQISPTARRSIPALFEPTAAPTAEDPLLPARQQRGTTRASQLDRLARTFAEASDPEKERGSDGPLDEGYALGPIRAALAGSRKIRLATFNAADLLHALDFLTGTGAQCVVERPVQVVQLAPRLAERKIPCVVHMPLRPAGANAGDWQQGDEETPRASPRTAGQLAAAGVAVAIAPASDDDLDKLRLVAGLACRFGMSEEKALAAITLEAARVLGVDDRVGSIERGKDADFVVLTGIPFDARSQVERVFVDGTEVWEPTEKRAAFAIRAGRVLIGDGSEHGNATVVVRDGKITAVGAGVMLPPGADVIDAPEAVLVPGFVAAATKLGLHTDSGTRIQAATDVDIAGALRHDDPVFRRALDAGITTLFVTPDTSGLVGSRICAVKTHGRADGFVIRPVTGLQLTLSSGGKPGKDQILGAIKKARTYIDPPNKKETPEKKEDKKPADPISGTWKGTVSGGPIPEPLEFTAELQLDGKNVEASLSISLVPEPITFTGTFEGDTLKLEGTAPPPVGRIELQGKLADEQITGSIKSTEGELSFSMSRVAAPGADTTAKKKDAEKKKVDETLEPFRPVLKGAAPLVVRVTNADAARAAIAAAVEESKLKLVLSGNPRDLIRYHVRPPEGSDVGFLLAAEEIYHEEKGKTRNVAQEIADLGFRVILVSRAQLGTRYLPVHAAWAVLTGFDPRDALRAITGTPASCFGVAGRVGLLREGRDADLVLLSGDPFDLTARVLGVWVDGVQHVDHLDEIKGTKENR